MRDIYNTLNAWGAWSANDPIGVKWSPIAAGFKGLIPNNNKSRQQCSDDDGIIIDSCVAKLKKIKPKEYELIVAHFILGISLRAIARKRKCSDGTVRKEMQLALGFVDGLLCVLNVNLDMDIL
ncbi:antitermination protein [Budviciaceae bacterium BWR-B9]|uniref:Antitermination protein n=1 Tax=Limnobaculum allomyrinae TaxID=2791986 RepID=A0ABS1IW40_9GAMM|nr:MULTISPECIES: antiterminator Q family protein [Limnobaculum]MBK5145980.1 antitermination protein [Limnobaculum allomyrinae]MBV7694039.1 antitermination protein [Limnobaculum sp. M2-1]